MSETSKDSKPLGLASTVGLGPVLEDAAYECLGALAGVDTYDIDLRDHPKAWAALEAFAAQVAANAQPSEVAQAASVGCCGAKLAEGQWAAICGQSDMGQTSPILCSVCDQNSTLTRA